MEQGIVQPDVTTRFDFKRLPVPFEKKNKPIVLKGVIKDDGTVADLKVFQGIVPGDGRSSARGVQPLEIQAGDTRRQECGG